MSAPDLEKADALEMCAEECAEVRGRLACARWGRQCRMLDYRPPRKIREVRMSAEFIEQVRAFSGDRRFPLKLAKR